jgi:ribosomal protein S12 methylthiotransferase accessory factor
LNRVVSNFSPITGILSNLSEMAGESWQPIHIQAAACVLPLDPRAPLSGSPPEIVVGRGWNEDDATLGCLAEGCERYSIFYQGGEPIVRARYKELGRDAVHPRELLFYSERQYSSVARDAAARESSIPVRFDDAFPVDWVEARSLTTGTSRLVPAAYCYLGHLEPSHPFCFADSNGCAAGADLESAVERGLLELIEREAAAVWWYNRLPAPGIPFDAFDDELLRRAEEPFLQNGLRVWLLQLASDWRVPVVAAVACGSDERSISYAFAAARSIEAASRSALTELVQTILSYDWLKARTPGDPRVRWRECMALRDRPFLLPAGRVGKLRLEAARSGDLVEEARELGLDPLAVDLSRSHVGVPVARVIVPGLRPLKPRFGPGRLFELPVSLGLASSVLSEEEMNADPLL